ncbi:acid phosphatase [Spathaspora passalidarum NRRL Y-27907]|uniref:Acid phosphatase n=1 Tax=Spathaspora passalidarum (strain NRRL Y-27907 / 11-Y1) TaxID=619300 RepID=G3AIH5_SPAPN|nr:acid phosphatase [Spathaspora passalidarum NRRL Y-27907]EGW34445.1 acid phosphatase [Spathaspora passalidarum NRRL Y-27907]
MVAISRILSPGLLLVSQDQFRGVAAPELAAESQYNIVKYLAAAGPYIQNPGFGISTDTPDQCTIEQVQLYMRHGERFPGLDAGIHHKQIVDKLQSYPDTLMGDLAFLNYYKYYATEDLYEYETTPQNSPGPYTGYETAIRAGAAFRAKYGHLYDDSKKLPIFIAASYRVYETALNFATSFLGEKYSQDKLNKVIISENATMGLNSLVPRWGCPAYKPNGNKDLVSKFPTQYLEKIVTRFQKSNPGLNITTDDVSQLFQICAYEMNSRGYSPFCDLFTEDEYVTYGYNQDVFFYYQSGPGGVNSKLAGSVQLNATLNLLKEDNPENKIWLTFTHDTDIELFSSALGLFDPVTPLPVDQVRFYDSYHHVDVIPMGGRFITEKLKCGDTFYVRFVVNDAVIPVPGCSDGPGFSCKLDKYEAYVLDRIGKYDIARDCKVPDNVPNFLSFYWDYKTVNYNASVPRQTA